jgi:hypothetical protein
LSRAGKGKVESRLRWPAECPRIADFKHPFALALAAPGVAAKVKIEEG